jgi:formate dehydrogenase subunit gamma
MPEPNQNPLVVDACKGFGNRPENLIEILHVVQNCAGHLSDEDLRSIADALNLTRAEVHGVVSFYHDFRRKRPGKTIIKICMAEACQAVGCKSIKDHAEETLSTAMGETSVNGDVTLEPVYCLGNCALGPAVMVDGALHGRITAERFDALVLEAGS